MPVVADNLSDELERLDRAFPTAVTVTRTSEEDFKSRQVVVRLDGTRIAELLWGDSVTVDVEPGEHRLHVHNTLVWKNVKFHVQQGEQAFFEVVNRATSGSYFWLSLLGVGPLYLTVRRIV